MRRLITTLQKFSPEDGTASYPVLTDRHNVIVIADEAHRSQYGFRAKVETGQIIKHPAMQNPTLVVLTDRNDLDDQLFGTFGMCKDLLRQTPQQAENRDHLRKLLDRPSGGVIFTCSVMNSFPSCLPPSISAKAPTGRRSHPSGFSSSSRQSGNSTQISGAK
jgi:type I site-specific restriction-modification system R (restriction) subunit